MKIRKGFVSNSSSTSFCICGLYFSHLLSDEILEQINIHNGVLGDLEDEIVVYCNGDFDETYVGIDIEYMKNFETRIEFETRCKKALQEIFPDITSVEFHYAEWGDG